MEAIVSGAGKQAGRKAGGTPRAPASSVSRRKGRVGLAADYAPVKLFLGGAQGRISHLKQGVPAGLVPALASEMGESKDALSQVLDIPRATLDRQIAAHSSLRKEHGERMLGLLALIGQVEAMVRESGDPEGFNAAAWVRQWAAQPNPALAGRAPREFLSTVTGQTVVSDLLAQMQSGAYA